MFPSVLVTGASGFLGSRIMRALPSAIGGHFRRAGVNTVPVDITSPPEVGYFFDHHHIDVCIHCAANPSVDSCEADPVAAHILNVEGTRNVAGACAASNVRLIHISSDYVFNGALEAYTEEDQPAPLQVYGQTKAAAEYFVQQVPGSLIVRLPLLYGPEFAEKLRSGEALALDDTAWRQPTHVDDAAAVLARLAGTDVTGILHVAANKGTTKYQWALGLAPDPSKIRRAAPSPGRPSRSWLATRKLESLHLNVKLRAFDE